MIQSLRSAALLVSDGLSNFNPAVELIIFDVRALVGRLWRAIHHQVTRRRIAIRVVFRDRLDGLGTDDVDLRTGTVMRIELNTGLVAFRIDRIVYPTRIVV